MRRGYVAVAVWVSITVISGLLLSWMMDRLTVKLAMDNWDMLRQDSAERHAVAEAARGAVAEYLRLQQSSPGSADLPLPTSSDAATALAVRLAGNVTVNSAPQPPGFAVTSNSTVARSFSYFGAIDWTVYADYGYDGLAAVLVPPGHPVWDSPGEWDFSVYRYYKAGSVRLHHVGVRAMFVPPTNYNCIAYSPLSRVSQEPDGAPSAGSDLMGSSVSDAVYFPSRQSVTVMTATTMTAASEKTGVITPGVNLVSSQAGVSPDQRFPQDLCWHYFDWLFADSTAAPSGMNLTPLALNTPAVAKDNSPGAPANRYIFDPAFMEDGTRYSLDIQGVELVIKTPTAPTFDPAGTTPPPSASCLWLYGGGTGVVTFDGVNNPGHDLLCVVTSCAVRGINAPKLYGALILGPSCTLAPGHTDDLKIWGSYMFPCTTFPVGFKPSVYEYASVSPLSNLSYERTMMARFLFPQPIFITRALTEASAKPW